jgi:hypothetical protein
VPEVVDQRRPRTGIDIRSARYDDALVRMHAQNLGLYDEEVALGIQSYVGRARLEL